MKYTVPVLFKLDGADAAAHLDVEAALPGDGPDGLEVGRRAVFGPVQVHQVEAVGPRLPEGGGLGGGVVAVDGHPAVVALGQADHPPAPQVNGWK